MNNTEYGSLILAISSLIIALAVAIKRCKKLQLGTCCLISLRENSSPPAQAETQLSDIENPGELVANAIMPVVDHVIRRLSHEVENALSVPPPPPA